jgi:hypothetical protein
MINIQSNLIPNFLIFYINESYDVYGLIFSSEIIKKSYDLSIHLAKQILI